MASKESVDDKKARELYPLHYLIFEDNVEQLEHVLSSPEGICNINTLDIHGRTPVMLATVLGHLKCAELLLEHGADANTQNREMWSLSHEAIPWKNHEFLKKLLTHRDYQRAIHTSKILLDLNKSLQNTSDFFVEMNWEFTSFLPFVANLCPSDKYKIYKSGSNIRIDANMLEIGGRSSGDNGNQSFIFRFTNETFAEIIFIDRNERIAYVQTLDLQSEPCLAQFVPDDIIVEEKFRSPITTTYVDVENVGFERSSKSSLLLSWIGHDKEEEVEGYTCRVMNASNVEIVTKSRIDHLTEEEKEEAARDASNNKTLSLLMGLFEKKRVSATKDESSSNHCDQSDVYRGVSALNYLTKPTAGGKPNIGKGRQEQIKSNTFNANLWLSETFPLNLRDQIFPIIDLLAVRNAKFSRLKSFIQLQLPSGFPIRIKIPIFHLINAQITFRNVNDPSQEDVERCSGVEEGDDVAPVFRLQQSLFQIPEGFERHELTGSLLFNRFEEVERTQTGVDSRYNAVDVEDEYVYLLERFMGTESPQTSTYEQQLQKAIEDSLAISSGQTPADGIATNGSVGEADQELLRALQLSKEEEEQRKRELEEEEESMKKALELSILEK